MVKKLPNAKLAKHFWESTDDAEYKCRLHELSERHWLQGMGIAISNCYAETGDADLARRLAGGMPYEDFVGIGLTQYDMFKIRAVFKGKK